MSLVRKLRLLGVIYAAAFYALASPCSAAPARKIDKVDPPTVMQGDTIALTITGESLPTGGVVVEFFPQQIAVLKVLSATEREIVVQVKVPSLAPPGIYNVVVYNQLGDEAFGASLLTIGSGIVTPVFRDFDPKVIADATSGFALMLTGDSITPAVIGHLSMQWLLGDQRLPNLQSTFGMGGAGTVVCAVAGKPPAGTLRGRLFMDDKPVYLVDVKVQGLGMAIVGHSPAQLFVSQAAYSIRILGANLDQDLVSTLLVTLESATTVAKATSVALSDSASIQAEFAAPLPPGEYTLIVKQGDSVIYTGPLKLQQDAIPTQPAAELPSGVLSQPTTSTVEQGDSTPQPGATAPVLKARITTAAPLGIPAGEATCRIVCEGVGLTGELAERVSATLIIGSIAGDLLFIGAQHDNLTCVFSAPAGGWQAGQSGRLSIVDPQNLMEPFGADVQVGPILASPQPMNAAPPASATAPAPGPNALPATGDSAGSTASASGGTWRAKSAYVTTSQGASVLCVTAGAPQADWNTSLLHGAFSLLPADSSATAAFSNLTLEGELAFRRSDAGEAIGEFAGIFVPGQLLVKLSYGDGVSEISVLEFKCPIPKASFIAPVVEKLQRAPASGMLLPETLRFVADFAPYVIKDPAFLVPVCSPPVNTAGALQLNAKGTQVEIVVQTRAWSSIHEWPDGFSFELDSQVALDWVSQPQLTVVVDAEMPQPEASATFASLPVLIDDKGFVVTIVPGGSEIPVAEWGKLHASSENLLLDRNLEQFQVIATSAQLAGQQCIRLRFRRDTETLSDMAYDILRSELLNAGEIQVKFAWDGLRCSAESKLTFEAALPGTLNDLLKNLSQSGSS